MKRSDAQSSSTRFTQRPSQGRRKALAALLYLFLLFSDALLSTPGTAATRTDTLYKQALQAYGDRNYRGPSSLPTDPRGGAGKCYGLRGPRPGPEGNGKTRGGRGGNPPGTRHASRDGHGTLLPGLDTGFPGAMGRGLQGTRRGTYSKTGPGILRRDELPSGHHRARPRTLRRSQGSTRKSPKQQSRPRSRRGHGHGENREAGSIRNAATRHHAHTSCDGRTTGRFRISHSGPTAPFRDGIPTGTVADSGGTDHFRRRRTSFIGGFTPPAAATGRHKLPGGHAPSAAAAA